jgi:hypothetical protein
MTEFTDFLQGLQPEIQTPLSTMQVYRHEPYWRNKGDKSNDTFLLPKRLYINIVFHRGV